MAFVIAGVFLVRIDRACARVRVERRLVISLGGAGHAEESVSQRPARIFLDRLLEIFACRFEIASSKGIHAAFDGGLLRQSDWQ